MPSVPKEIENPHWILQVAETLVGPAECGLVRVNFASRRSFGAFGEGDQPVLPVFVPMARGHAAGKIVDLFPCKSPGKTEARS